MRTSEFLLAARLDAPALAAWVEAGWLLPRQEEDTADFSDVDLARARLIRDLQRDMGVNEEAIPIVLDLLDQVHGLRQLLRDLAAAVVAQPEDTRQRIVAEIRAAASVRAVAPAREGAGGASDGNIR